MANTTIALRQSGATGNTPSLGVLANGELSINYADGIIYYKTAANALGSIRTTQPAGLTTEVQFNDAGSFGTDSNFTYNKSTDILTVGGGVIAAGINVAPALIANATIAQGGFDKANTANITADASFTKANAANVLAQAAFDKANTGNVLAQSAFDKANTANVTAEAAYSKANSANVLAQNAYNAANSAATIADILALSIALG